MTELKTIEGVDSGPEGYCPVAAKWAVVADDVVVPVPGRFVPVDLVKSLAGVPEDFVLMRDHNSPDDVVLVDQEHIDLAEGNVFYGLARCELHPRGKCHDVPKRAFVVDDRAEIVIHREIRGDMLRELFGLPPQARRDRIGVRGRMRAAARAVNRSATGFVEV